MLNLRTVLREKLERLKVHFKAPPLLKIGCDPEFTVMNKSTGEMVHAAWTLYGEGKSFTIPEGNAGTDGSLGELRPTPSASPREVVKNLQVLIQRIREHLKETNQVEILLKGNGGSFWKYIQEATSISGESFYCSGGHLHFDFQAVSQTGAGLLGKALFAYLVPALYLLGGKDAFRRAINYYRNNLGSGFVLKNHVPYHSTWEFRVLPSFLESPVLATFTLGLAHLLWKEVLRNPKKMEKKLKAIKGRYLSLSSASYSLPYPNPGNSYQAFQAGLRRYWKGKEEEIEQMKGWEDYREEFLEVFEKIRKGEGFDPFFQGW